MRLNNLSLSRITYRIFQQQKKSQYNIFVLQFSPPTCRWQRVSRDRSLSRLLALSLCGLLGWRSFSDVLLPRLPANFGSCLKKKTEEERWRTVECEKQSQ